MRGDRTAEVERLIRYARVLVLVAAFTAAGLVVLLAIYGPQSPGDWAYRLGNSLRNNWGTLTLPFGAALCVVGAQAYARALNAWGRIAGRLLAVVASGSLLFLSVGVMPFVTYITLPLAVASFVTLRCSVKQRLH